MDIKNYKEASFAAGCFWGVEELFRITSGVIETEVGYMGGHVKNPTYEQVCTGDTGHAESVHLVYDPRIISYGQLLDVFWKLHNPTTVNRQGPDIGEQYRSVIFYYDEEQKENAEKSKKELDVSKKWNNPVVTEIIPASIFYRAEEYHQKYATKHEGFVCHI